MNPPVDMFPVIIIRTPQCIVTSAVLVTCIDYLSTPKIIYVMERPLPLKAWCR